jgi:hypothetical protein
MALGRGNDNDILFLSFFKIKCREVNASNVSVNTPTQYAIRCIRQDTDRSTFIRHYIGCLGKGGKDLNEQRRYVVLGEFCHLSQSYHRPYIRFMQLILFRQIYLQWQNKL